MAEPETRASVVRAFRVLQLTGVPVRWLDPSDVRSRVGESAFTGGYVLAGGGSVDPVGIAHEMARAAAGSGALILEGVTLETVHATPHGFRSITDRIEIASAAVVYAIPLQVTPFLGQFATRLTAVEEWSLLSAPVARRFELPFTTDWKTHVWRQRPDGRIAASGRGTAEEARPGSSVRSRICPPLTVERGWRGGSLETPDYLPLVGGLPGRSGEWLITGFDSAGFAFSFEAGRALAHAIAGDAPVRGAALLDPGRLLAMPERRAVAR